ncbi:serine O-acetyltransferase [Enterococcus casseliflavus]|uniref:serine O-acetyltransferase n=1 Tax=Enterococcus casseliflavus TaxID=37734 RepID=UPI0039A487A2
MIKELKSTKILRLAIYLERKRIPFGPKILQKFLRLFYNFEVIISPNLILGRNVRFCHNGLGTVINQNAKIGSNVKIYQNVTIGSNKKIINGVEVDSGAPTIEDNVVIFTGAVIVGNIVIGEGSVIGANIVVTKSLPKNSILINNNFIQKEKKTNIVY